MNLFFTLIILFSFIIIISLLNQFFNFIIIKYFEHKQKKTNTALIFSKESYSNPQNWITSSLSYFCFFCFIMRLKYLGKEFTIYRNLTSEKFIKIIEDENIKQIYLFGHGNRHSYKINPKERIYYCIFDKQSYKLINKDFIAQYHCNHEGGKSLPEYINSKRSEVTITKRNAFILGLEFIKEFLTLNQYETKKDKVNVILTFILFLCFNIILCLIYFFIIFKLLVLFGG